MRAILCAWANQRTVKRPLSSGWIYDTFICLNTWSDPSGCHLGVLADVFECRYEYGMAGATPAPRSYASGAPFAPHTTKMIMIAIIFGGSQ